MKTVHYLVLALALCAVAWMAFPSSGSALCKVGKAKKSEDAAKRQETKLKQMLRALGTGSSEKDQVVLTDPGTVTTIASGKGLTDPRPWSAAEKARFDTARVNTSLPEPKGVWK